MNWYLGVLKNYVGFNGRARRTEFWMFVLFNVIIGVVLTLLGRVSEVFTILYYLYGLAVLIPGLAVAVRRLHDTNRSGWWILIGLVPFVGAIILLVFYCIGGDPGANQYGADPKAIPATA